MDGLRKREGMWRYSYLTNFCHCLRMPTEGFEGEILKLFNRMRERRD